MVENPEVARKQEEEKQLLVSDQQLDEIFEALGPKEMFEEMMNFYGEERVIQAIPENLISEIVLQKRSYMSVSQLETVEYFAKSGIYSKFKLEESD